MIVRTYDTQTIAQAVADYSSQVSGFDPEAWVQDDQNIALVNDNGDVALFERQWRAPTTVAGHYFFKSRGKIAREVAKDFLWEIFLGPYQVEIIAGLTPVEHLGALWMNKQLGFKQHGEIETPSGKFKFVMLTKQEWLKSEGIEE